MSENKFMHDEYGERIDNYDVFEFFCAHKDDIRNKTLSKELLNDILDMIVSSAEYRTEYLVRDIKYSIICYSIALYHYVIKYMYQPLDQCSTWIAEIHCISNDIRKKSTKFPNKHTSTKWAIEHINENIDNILREAYKETMWKAIEKHDIDKKLFAGDIYKNDILAEFSPNTIFDEDSIDGFLYKFAVEKYICGILRKPYKGAPDDPIKSLRTVETDIK